MKNVPTSERKFGKIEYNEDYNLIFANIIMKCLRLNLYYTDSKKWYLIHYYNYSTDKLII